MMMSMMDVCKQGVHIVPQYIQIGRIWQVQIVFHFAGMTRRLEPRRHKGREEKNSLCVLRVFAVKNYGIFIPQMVFPSCLKKPE
jgi:hypothetical protein